MEKNYITENQETYFYVDAVLKEYGVCVNNKYKEEAEEIIKECLEQNRRMIEAWKQEWKVGVA